MKYHVAF